VINVVDKDMARDFLFLEMALQAQRLVALRKHPLIDGTVRRMAGHAAFAQGLVLENERSTLRGMTLETGFVLTEQRDPAALEGLRKTGASAFDGAADVRVMAIRAANLPFEDRVMMRQLELRADLQVTLKTGLGRTAGIDDRARAAAARDVQTSGTVTRFAADIFRVVSRRFESRVRRGRERSRDLFVTGGARFRADEFSSGNAWRRENGVFGRAARKQNDGERGRSSHHPY